MPAPDFQETPDDDVDDSDHEERAPTEPGPPEKPDGTAETSDHVRENTAELVPHSSSSHWEWRPEYEVPPPEPGDPVVTRRRVVAKRHPTADQEEEIRQKP